MSDDKPEASIVDYQSVEIVDEDEANDQSDRMASMRQYKTKAKRKSKTSNISNTTKICEEFGYVPVVTLIHLAMNNPQALGHTQNVPMHTQLSAATTLVHLTTPGLKAVDFVNTEEVAAKILTYTPERGTVDDTIAELEKELALEEFEDDEDYYAAGEEDLDAKAEEDNF